MSYVNMSCRGKTLHTCPRCWLLQGVCICDRLPRLKPSTRVVMHMHHNEWCGRPLGASPVRTKPCRTALLFYFLLSLSWIKAMAKPRYQHPLW